MWVVIGQGVYAPPTRMLFRGTWTVGGGLVFLLFVDFRRKVQPSPSWVERHTELDEVPDGAHDEETDANGLGDLDEFRAVGCEQGRVSRCCAGRFGDGIGRTLLGAVDELDAVLEELARHVEDLLELVGHCGG